MCKGKKNLVKGVCVLWKYVCKSKFNTPEY